MTLEEMSKAVTDARIGETGRAILINDLGKVIAHGQPEIVVPMMKPWAVAVTLMLPPSETGMVLDLLLYQEALAAGKNVSGLESASEQMDVFDSMSKEDQIALLKDALDSQQDIKRMLVELKAAYLARDLKRLVEISDKSMRGSSQRTRDHFNRRLLLERKLVRILGRKEIPGRPLIYATTKEFLEVFDLKDLKDLPTLKEIDAFGNPVAEEAEKTSTGDTESPAEEN